MPLHEAIFTEPGVAGAKYGMSLLGLCSDEVRLPLVGLTDDTKDKMKWRGFGGWPPILHKPFSLIA